MCLNTYTIIKTNKYDIANTTVAKFQYLPALRYKHRSIALSAHYITIRRDFCLLKSLFEHVEVINFVLIFLTRTTGSTPLKSEFVVQ